MNKQDLCYSKFSAVKRSVTGYFKKNGFSHSGLGVCAATGRCGRNGAPLIATGLLAERLARCFGCCYEAFSRSLPLGREHREETTRLAEPSTTAIRACSSGQLLHLCSAAVIVPFGSQNQHTHGTSVAREPGISNFPLRGACHSGAGKDAKS